MIRLRKAYLVLSVLFVQNTYSNVDQKKYFKCHSIFTSARPKLSDPLLEKVRRKELSGTQACMSLLSQANLNSNLVLDDPENKKAKVILRNFLALYNSWFNLYNLNKESQDHTNTNVYDSNEMAYFLTASTFGNNIPYKHLLTSKYSYRAIRLGNGENLFQNDPDIEGKRSNIFEKDLRKWVVGGVDDQPEAFGSTYNFKPPLIEFGEFIGLKKTGENKKSFKRLYKGKKLSEDVDFSTPEFRGAFGTKSYLLLSLAFDNTKTDGGTKLHRRWATNLLNDFLCRKLPVIRPNDTVVHDESKIAFKTKKNCMACHHTTDNLAGLTRNLESFNAGEAHNEKFTFRGIYKHKTTHPKMSDLTDKDKNFFKRPTHAKFIFRTYNGELINKTLINPNELGPLLAKLDDPYLCTAKRLVDHFTGLNIDVYDFKQFEVNESDTHDLEVRKFVIKLSKKLKAHQNIQKIIKSIIDSKYFLDGLI